MGGSRIRKFEGDTRHQELSAGSYDIDPPAFKVTAGVRVPSPIDNNEASSRTVTADVSWFPLSSKTAQAGIALHLEGAEYQLIQRGQNDLISNYPHYTGLRHYGVAVGPSLEKVLYARESVALSFEASLQYAVTYAATVPDHHIPLSHNIRIQAGPNVTVVTPVAKFVFGVQYAQFGFPNDSPGRVYLTTGVRF